MSLVLTQCKKANAALGGLLAAEADYAARTKQERPVALLVLSHYAGDRPVLARFGLGPRSWRSSKAEMDNPLSCAKRLVRGFIKHEGAGKSFDCFDGTKRQGYWVSDSAVNAALHNFLSAVTMSVYGNQQDRLVLLRVEPDDACGIVLAHGGKPAKDMRNCSLLMMEAAVRYCINEALAVRNQSS